MVCGEAESTNVVQCIWPQLGSKTYFKGDKSQVTKLVMVNVDLVEKFWWVFNLNLKMCHILSCITN
jgi:hypothetical protein